ncbi:MAG: hypothetical protein K8J08_15255 [Thermoanaerobaculia bacterium]|nr:hypothetical protein [Thermoanaerobaculia bacterium]
MKALAMTLLLAAPLLLWTCGERAPGDSNSVPEDGTAAEADASEEAVLQRRIETYAPVLAEAYSTGNIEILREFAVERVLAQVEKRVSDLATSGMRVEAKLVDLTVESTNLFGNNFALVTTLETWDLHYYSTGSARSLVSERLGTRNRIEYQMKQIDGDWMIYFRELKQEFDDLQ